MNKIIQLYSDKNKTIKAYPKTLASQVYMDDGQTTITSQLESNVQQLNQVKTEYAKKSEVNTLADSKADKTTTYIKDEVYNKTQTDAKVWTMANMGQDVKTAMTGGSVAVVGTDSVDTVNVKNNAITTGKRTRLGTTCRLVVDRPINIDLINNKIVFPNTGNLFIFYGNEYFNIPANTEIPLDLAYGSGFVCFDTDTKTFVSLRYGRANSTYVKESYILVFGISNNTVNIECQYTVNGQYEKTTRDKLDYINTNANIVEYGDYPVSCTVSGSSLTVTIENSLFIMPTEKAELLYFSKNSGTSNYTLTNGSYDSINKIWNFTLESSKALVGNWLDKTIRYCSYSQVKNGDFLLAYNYYGKLTGGILKDIIKEKQINILQTTVDKINEQLNDTGKVYIDEEVKNKTLECSKKNGMLKFAFMTDTHDHPIYKRDYKFGLLNKLAKTGCLDLIVNGGDCLGYDTKDEVMKVFQEYNKAITNGINIPYFLCKGNHDGTGNIYSPTNTSNILSDLEWYNIGCKSIGSEVVFDESNPCGGYYYKDFNHAKIRVINLNTSQIDGLSTFFDPMNVLIQQSQIDWLYNKALNFSDKTDKSNWGVVIVSHAALNKEELGGLNGQQVIEGILKAFMEGGIYQGSQHTQGTPQYVSANVNFTSQGKMEFICAVNGHMHYDRVSTFTTLNRPNINIGSVKSDMTPVEKPDAVRPNRVSGTITDELLDLISIDTINRKIYCTRFGAGTNKEISY